MQWINFIRDIDEDNHLGRQYFPSEDISSCELKDLSAESAKKHPEAFEKFIHKQISRYQTWQDEASIGHAYIPRSLRIPVKTAVDMYNWTAMKIAEHPQLVFEKKLKPSKTRVMARAAWRSINA